MGESKTISLEGCQAPAGWALPARPGGLGLIPVSRTGSLHPFSHAKALLIHHPIREVGGQKRAAKACSDEECWAAWRTQAELRCSQGEESCGQSTRRLPGRSSSIPADPAELHSRRHRSLEPMECCLYLTHLQIRGKHWCLTYTSYFYLRMGRGSCWIRRSHPWLNDQWQKHDLAIKECFQEWKCIDFFLMQMEISLALKHNDGLISSVFPNEYHFTCKSPPSKNLILLKNLSKWQGL